MNIQKELFINEQQPVYGFKNTYTGEIFQAIIDNADNHSKGGSAGNPHFLMSQAFTCGVIQGKRSERARRKGEPFKIDRNLTDLEVLRKLADMLRGMSVEEIQKVHAAALNELEFEPAVEELLNQMIERIIKERSSR